RRSRSSESRRRRPTDTDADFLSHSARLLQSTPPAIVTIGPVKPMKPWLEVRTPTRARDSKSPGELDRDAAGGVGDHNASEPHRHRWAARWLEHRRQRERELRFAVLHREVTCSLNTGLVGGLWMLPAAVDAFGRCTDDDVNLSLIAEAGLF